MARIETKEENTNRNDNVLTITPNMRIKITDMVVLLVHADRKNLYCPDHGVIVGVIAEPFWYLDVDLSGITEGPRARIAL